MAEDDLTLRRQLVGKLHRVGIPPEDVTLVAVDKPAIAGHRNWVVLAKLADETKNSDAALADDAELTVAVQADEILLGRLCIFYTTVAAADFKFKFNSTQTADMFEVFGTYHPHGITPPVAFHSDDLADETSILGASDGQGAMGVDFRLQNGATAGLFSFQWAQDTSNAGDTALLAGSFIEYFTVDG